MANSVVGGKSTYELLFFLNSRSITDSRTQQRQKRKKPCFDSSIGSCVRACVTEARATVYVCVHMPKECVCERKDVHACCRKKLAARTLVGGLVWSTSTGSTRRIGRQHDCLGVTACRSAHAIASAS